MYLSREDQEWTIAWATREGRRRRRREEEEAEEAEEEEEEEAEVEEQEEEKEEEAEVEEQEEEKEEEEASTLLEGVSSCRHCQLSARVQIYSPRETRYSTSINLAEDSEREAPEQHDLSDDFVSSRHAAVASAVCLARRRVDERDEREPQRPLVETSTLSTYLREETRRDGDSAPRSTRFETRYRYNFGDELISR